MARTDALSALQAAQARSIEVAKRAADRLAAYETSLARQQSGVWAVTMTNVPYDATAADVAAFCRQHVDIRGFLSVSMAAFQREELGRSTVYVDSPHAHRCLLDLDGLSWDGETLSVRQGDAIARSVCTDVMSEVFHCRSVHLLHGIDPLFVASSGVTLTTSGVNTVAFSIAFDADERCRYRVAFKAVHVLACHIGIDECDDVVVRLTLQTAPYVYVGDRTVTDEGRLWPIADATYKWERSDDPSTNGAFGTCRIYHLVLGGRTSPEYAASVLRAFGVDVLLDEAPAPVCDTPLSPPMNDWAHGFASCLHHLSFAVRYALHVLLSQDVLHLTRADDAIRIAAVIAETKATAADVLGVLQSALRGSSEAPMDAPALMAWLRHRPAPSSYRLQQRSSSHYQRPATTLSTCIDDMKLATVPHVRRALVTPLRVVVEAPEVDVSNRVLRLYAAHLDRFLRVSFVDENLSPIYNAKTPRVLDRVASILRDGLVVAGDTYVFLGYSNSQMRTHSCWFYRNPSSSDATDVPSAASIRLSLGDMHAISSASMRGARLGQAFSTTTSTVALASVRYGVRPDIVRNGYVFSDGIGAISPRLSAEIAASLGLAYVPSAYQIRFGGWKGVVCVDTALTHDVCDMQLRMSMRKFASDHEEIEVCNVPQVAPAYLNRQLITLLTTLGVRDEAILNLADDMLHEATMPLDTPTKAIRFLRRYAPKAPILRLLQAGVSVHDRFVAEWLHVMRRYWLRCIQRKARLRVHDSVVLMGVLDETNTLPEGCIFFQLSGLSRYPMTPPAFGTRCVVGRNPSLHPGDLRLLTYTDAPALRHLYDVLVFSSRGDRPVTDMMSSGDLDGDVYFCLWDDRLVPAQEMPPMQPDPSLAIPPPIMAPGVTGIMDHFVRFLAYDNLGMIANMHLAVADQSRHKANNVRALELAHAHAIAVDFAKSGIAASLPTFNLNAMPDFMQRPGPRYASKSVLGVLYRRTCDIAVAPLPTSHRHDMETAVLLPGFEAFVDDAWHWWAQYAHALLGLMETYGVATEVELVSGYMETLARTPGRKGSVDPTDDAVERIRVAVRCVQEHYASVFWRGLRSKSPSDRTVLTKASAWYFVANSYKEDTLPCRSFAWLALEPMLVLFEQRA